MKKEPNFLEPFFRVFCVFRGSKIGFSVGNRELTLAMGRAA